MFVHKPQTSLYKMNVVRVTVATVCVHMVAELNCLLRLDETLVCGTFGFSDLQHTMSFSLPLWGRERETERALCRIITIFAIQGCNTGNIIYLLFISFQFICVRRGRFMNFTVNTVAFVFFSVSIDGWCVVSLAVF